MKKSTIILWGVAALFLLCSLPFFGQGQIAEGVCGIGISAVLFFVGLRKKKAPPTMKQESQPLTNPAPASAPPKQAAAPAVPPEPARAEISAATIAPPAPKQPEVPPAAAPSAPSVQPPKEITFPCPDGFSLKYSYPDVELVECTPQLVSGVPIGTLAVLEEETPDAVSGRIAAVYKGVRFGFLPSNRLETMVHDFRARGGAVLAKFAAISPTSVMLAVAYYEEVETKYAALLKSGAVHKVYKLTGTSSEEKQDNISICSSGNSVEYEYDVDTGKYTAVFGGDIGYFPKSAEPLLEAGAQAFIDRIDYNDEKDKYIVYVALFPTEG